MTSFMRRRSLVALRHRLSTVLPLSLAACGGSRSCRCVGGLLAPSVETPGQTVKAHWDNQAHCPIFPAAECFLLSLPRLTRRRASSVCLDDRGAGAFSRRPLDPAPDRVAWSGE